MQIASLICSFVIVFLSLSSVVRAQNVDPCAIYQDPSQFCGKMITVRGTTGHFMEGGGLMNDRCRTGLSGRTPERAGVRVRFKLKRDESWQTFTHYDSMSWDLPVSVSVDGPRVSHPDYKVTATFHGLFACNRKRFPWYFLVVESVSDVKVEQD
jgi:hypothetical protein